MDQLKIGRFISNCRKAKGLTQMQLAERLNITDRAVSKWETGRALPDASIMLDLCSLLEISVNDLLSGEVVAMENYNKELENKLIEMVKQKEEADKRLLKMEVVIGVLSVIVLFAVYRHRMGQARGLLALGSLRLAVAFRCRHGRRALPFQSLPQPDHRLYRYG